MEYKFRIGQVVRIGNECPTTNTNYHKRGRIVAVDEEGQIIVDMIRSIFRWQNTYYMVS